MERDSGQLILKELVKSHIMWLIFDEYIGLCKKNVVWRDGGKKDDNILQINIDKYFAYKYNIC